MKGGDIVTKAEAKQFLRICKSVDFIKLNYFLKSHQISQPSISRFVNYDEYDDFISLDNLETLCNEIYNSCGFIVDMFQEICEDKKIA